MLELTRIKIPNYQLQIYRLQKYRLQKYKLQNTGFKYTGEDYASSGNRIREDYHAQGENYEGGFERGQ